VARVAPYVSYIVSTISSAIASQLRLSSGFDVNLRQKLLIDLYNKHLDHTQIDVQSTVPEISVMTFHRCTSTLFPMAAP